MSTSWFLFQVYLCQYILSVVVVTVDSCLSTCKYVKVSKNVIFTQKTIKVRNYKQFEAVLPSFRLNTFNRKNGKYPRVLPSFSNPPAFTFVELAIMSTERNLNERFKSVAKKWTRKINLRSIYIPKKSKRSNRPGLKNRKKIFYTEVSRARLLKFKRPTLLLLQRFALNAIIALDQPLQS